MQCELFINYWWKTKKYLRRQRGFSIQLYSNHWWRFNCSITGNGKTFLRSYFLNKYHVWGTLDVWSLNYHLILVSYCMQTYGLPHIQDLCTGSTRFGSFPTNELSYLFPPWHLPPLLLSIVLLSAAEHKSWYPVPTHTVHHKKQVQI